MMKVKPSKATRMMAKFVKAGRVPMVHGSPGIAKSALVRKVAQEHNLKVIDVRLAQCDPTDLLGFPQISEQHIEAVTLADGTKVADAQVVKRAEYAPMTMFPLEHDPIPDGYDGWLIFFDEFNACAKAVQAAAYKIVLERQIGPHNLHKRVAMICAGNLETDNGIVEPMSTPMQSRLVHMELIVDAPEWIDWANENHFDHRITSFIGFKPSALFTFKPDHQDTTFACPRTWEFANSVMKVTADDDEDRLEMLAGTLTEGMAREFLAYCRIHADLPKVPAIAANPEGIQVPSELSVLFAITDSIAHHTTKDNISQLMKFIVRLPKEFQAVCLRGMVRRNKTLMTTTAVQDWVRTSAIELF